MQRALRPVVQAKLGVAPAHDPAEEEADRVADEVMRSPGHGPAKSAPVAIDEKPADDAPQHECSCAGEGECEQCRQRGGEAVHRKARGDGEAHGGRGTPAPAVVGDTLKTPGEPLDRSTRGFMESRFGRDFGDVRLHTDAAAAFSADRIGARAYASGRHVVFGANQYQPHSESGRRLLGHELVHVVQQEGGGRGGASGSQVRRQPDDESASESSATATEDAGGSSGSRTSTVMSASMQGLFFSPPPATTFSAGSKGIQGLAIMLRRLVVEYEAGYEETVYAAMQRGPGLAPLGTLIGDAQGGEPVGELYLPVDFATGLIRWLEDEGKTVAISSSQRDLLRFGTYASAAWEDAHLDELGVSLPEWFTVELFRAEMASHIALLRQYIDAVEWLQVEPTPENRAIGVAALRRIIDVLNVPARVLEAIRGDAELTAHSAYQHLWATAEPAGATPTTGTSGPTTPGTTPLPPPAEPGRAPHFVIARAFLTFVRTQPDLARRSLEESTARRELLDRFERFAARAARVEGDQQVAEAPGRANAPPLPGSLGSYPPLEPPLFDAALETDHRFIMQLRYSDFYEAFAAYSYDWDYVRVPDEEISGGFDVESAAGNRPSLLAVAGTRYGRAGRYAVADIERVIGDIGLAFGPAGVHILTLTAAGALLRFIGTTFRFALDLLTTPMSQKPIVFPEEGLYVVRCRATPVVEDTDEVVRSSTVAYLPVLVRAPQEMAETRVRQDVAGRDAAIDRVVELQGLLSEPVSHANQDELERELRDLTAALGTVGEALRGQETLLNERLSTLGAGHPEREGIERQLERIRQTLQVHERRGGNVPGAERIIASFVSDEGQTVRLFLQALAQPGGGSRSHYLVSDLTTPNSSQGEGFGSSRVEAILQGIRDILEGMHGYGRGYASVWIDGTPHTLRVEASLGSILVEAVENVATAISIAAVVAAPFTGGASLAILIPVGIIGAIPSAYRIIDRAIDGTLRFDMALAMDVVNIAGSLVGLGGETAAAFRMVRLGRGLMIAGIGADALGMLLMGVGVVEQILALEGLPPGLRLARMMEIIGQAMLNVGIAVGGALAQRGRMHELETGTPRSTAHEGRTPLGPDVEMTSVRASEPVRVAGEAHTVRIGDRDGRLAVEICTDCRALRTRIERVVDDPALAAFPEVNAELTRLRDQAGRLERDLNAGRITPDEARTACDDITRQINDLAGRHPNELGPVVGIPRGFADRAQLTGFGAAIHEHLNGLVSYHEAHIQGSSVTGRSYHTGRPYGAHSDIDVAIVSRELFNAAAEAPGADIRDGVRAHNALPDVIDPMTQRLSELMGGREVNVVIFESRRAMEAYADSIPVP